MIGRSFEPVRDALGHNVVGITFDQPIPWPLFDGGPVDCPKEQNLADGIQAVLDGEEKKDKERINALDGALTDLADEIEEEVEGDLKSATTGLEDALTYLRRVRARVSEATAKVEPQPGAQASIGAAAAHDRLVRRSLALDHLLNPEVVDCIGEAISEVDAALKRVYDAVTDLSKQAAEAKAVES